MKLRPFSCEVEGETLRGAVYEPEGGIDEGQSYPAAVLFHGFGGNRVDVSCFIVQMAKALAARGLVVVTYDRAGHGESDGEFFDTSVSKDVRQGCQVLRAVADLPYVDKDRIALGGLSLGAVICSIVAAESEIPVKAMVMCSTAAFFVDEIASGFIQGKPLPNFKAGESFDFMGMKMGPAMVDDASSIDVYRRAQPFKGKVLLMHGTRDFVPLSYARRYKDMWGEQAVLLVREDADHGWASVPDREFVTEHAADFLGKQLA
ncbi:alpha/beta hydrolase family protein [Parascardovia denticolens]|uniref:alpha/beta hydrolase family protein n=1 Tax=Parascardovia denticolens TaxID=78258 RepID=UPI00248ED62F|nr:alpha/beta fold hydrolase [Parascardovia denticolens]